jgi:hypothetical protein
MITELRQRTFSYSMSVVKLKRSHSPNILLIVVNVIHVNHHLLLGILTMMITYSKPAQLKRMILETDQCLPMPRLGFRATQAHTHFVPHIAIFKVGVISRSNYSTKVYLQVNTPFVLNKKKDKKVNPPFQTKLEVIGKTVNRVQSCKSIIMIVLLVLFHLSKFRKHRSS